MILKVVTLFRHTYAGCEMLLYPAFVESESPLKYIASQKSKPLKIPLAENKPLESQLYYIN